MGNRVWGSGTGAGQGLGFQNKGFQAALKSARVWACRKLRRFRGVGKYRPHQVSGNCFVLVWLRNSSDSEKWKPSGAFNNPCLYMSSKGHSRVGMQTSSP